VTNGKGKYSKITEHFYLVEFAQPERHGLPGEPYPIELVQDNLFPLCRVLEVVRSKFGKPIEIVSGWRSELYNRKVGGARLSRHCKGDAADFRVVGVDAAIVHGACIELEAAGSIQIGGLGHYSTFTHIDLRPHRARWSGSRTKS